MKAIELTKCCTFVDALYPPGYVCRTATNDECDFFMFVKNDEQREKAQKILEDGGLIVYLNGRLRILESGSFRIVSKNEIT